MMRFFLWWWLLTAVVSWLPVPAQNYYNRGLSLYRQGQYAAAETAFKRAFADPRLGAWAYYNAGNAAFEQGRFPAAEGYYAAALELSPEDEDAWHNLQLARSRLPDAGGSAAGPAPEPPRSQGLAGSRPNPALSESDRCLAEARQAETKWLDYFHLNPGPQSRRSRPRPAQDIFSLSPEELAQYIQAQTHAGYPFKPGQALWQAHSAEDQVDW